MPSFSVESAPPLRRLAVSADEASFVLFGRTISRSFRCRLQKRGDFPPTFMLGGGLAVATADLESLISRKAAGATVETEQRQRLTAAATAERQRRRQQAAGGAP